MSGMGDDNRLVYLCRSSIDLDDIYRGSYGGPVETIQQRFFGQDGISLRRYEFELKPGDKASHQNVILVASGDYIEGFVYKLFNKDDFGWRSDRIHRSARQELVRDYIKGNITLAHTENNKRTQYRIRTEGPRIIIIDSSKTLNRRQPSVEQYAKIAIRQGGIARVVNEDSSREIFFDPGPVMPEPSTQRPEDDDRYAFA